MLDLSYQKEISSYARAVLSLAKEKNQEESVCDDMMKVKDMFTELFQNRQFHSHQFYLIPKDKQLQFVQNIFSSCNLTKLSSEFITLLITTKRFGLLKDIVLNWEEVYSLVKGKYSVRVISAINLSDDQKREIELVIKSKFETDNIKEIEDNTGYSVYYKVDKNILGGLIIYIGNRMYDDSIKSKLAQIVNNISGKNI